MDKKLYKVEFVGKRLFKPIHSYTLYVESNNLLEAKQSVICKLFKDLKFKKGNFLITSIKEVAFEEFIVKYKTKDGTKWVIKEEVVKGKDFKTAMEDFKSKTKNIEIISIYGLED